MTVNTAALKARLDKFNKVKSDKPSDSILWRPTEGKHTIRLVPYAHTTDENGKLFDFVTEGLFIELKFTYLGGKTQISPTTFGRRDPIAEFGNANLGTRSKEEYEKVKIFLPSLRTYVPIIVRGEEDKGVRYFPFGITVYKQLLEIMGDDEIGNIADPITGRDLVVTYVPKEKSSKKGFPETTLMYRPSSTPLSTDKALVKQFLTVQPDLLSIFKEASYSELKDILQKFLMDGAEEEVEEAEEVPEVTQSEKVSAKAEKSVEKKSNSIDDVMAEFDTLFES